ncbi:hypothetical protein KCP76_22545 [Salmonella enterica subsp. enterica serovar Weltevreden]|nr:hypothetical protein KCP76_22545 [Salmonella enterica subsp. enterica serovar Weltevreden]
MKWVLWYARSNPPFLRFERAGGPAQITTRFDCTFAGRSGDIMGCIGIKAYHWRRVTSRHPHPPR